MPPSQTIAQACHALHPIGTALTDAATILAEMRDQLPKRGPLTDLYIELLHTLAHVEHTHRNASDTLLTAYRQLEHAERAQRQGWTPQPLNGKHP